MQTCSVLSHIEKQCLPLQVVDRPNYRQQRRPTTPLVLYGSIQFDRRGLLSLLALALSLKVARPAVAAAPRSDDLLFSSKQAHFQLQYPSDWVLAFDRTSKVFTDPANPIVVVLGDFKNSYATASVSIGPELSDGTLESLDDAKELITQRITSEEGIMKFKLLSATLIDQKTFDYEYYIKTCPGVVQEQKGGTLQCLNSLGGDAAIKERQFLCRYMILPNGNAFTVAASVSQEQWSEMKPVLAAIVSSFQPTVGS